MANTVLPGQTVPAAPDGAFPAQMTLAMAYVPYQYWEAPYSAEEALCRGTVFPSLDMPFLMGKGGFRDEAAAVFGQNGKG
ncbi:MAG: spore coat associated protein CotJA [Oscillospiraceae bacterium]|nr:spore coat associated protein CotJA [Oscillospiraceae bacterium]